MHAWRAINQTSGWNKVYVQLCWLRKKSEMAYLVDEAFWEFLSHLWTFWDYWRRVLDAIVHNILPQAWSFCPTLCSECGSAASRSHLHLDWPLHKVLGTHISLFYLKGNPSSLLLCWWCWTLVVPLGLWDWQYCSHCWTRSMGSIWDRREKLGISCNWYLPNQHEVASSSCDHFPAFVFFLI